MCTKLTVFDKLILFGIVLCVTATTHAYQVWTSTCKTPEWVLKSLDEWDLMAARLEGLNANFAPSLGHPDYNPNGDQWRAIVARYTKARENIYQPWGHPDDQPDGSKTVVTEASAWAFFRKAIDDLRNNRGMTLKYFMLYDHGGDDGKINAWTEEEFNSCRAALNNNGLASIKLIYNCRSYGNRNKLAWPAVDIGLNEGSTEKWFTNQAGRQDLLRFVATDPVVKQKPFIFQITTHHDFEDGHEDAFVAQRRFMRLISTDILGSTDFMQSDRTIFLPMTYGMFPEHFDFIPEHTADGTAYGNSMSGMLLSMMEQKDLFEGRHATVIGEAEADSFQRTHYTVEGEDATSGRLFTLGSEGSSWYGSGYLDLTAAPSYAEWSGLSGEPAGVKNMTLYYANGSGDDRRCDIGVNGVHRAAVVFPPTGGWDTWRSHTLTIDLPETLNTLTIQADVESGGVRIDYFKVKWQYRDMRR